MAENARQPAATEPSEVTDKAPAISWRTAWQAPVILGSIAAIVWGIYTIQARRPQNDFDGALTQVETMIAAGEFDGASARLTTVIEPYLHEATRDQQARFHAAVADWMSLSPGSTTDLKRQGDIDAKYAKAQEMGVVLSAARLERWAMAQLQLGRVEEANKRLKELGALAKGEHGEEARTRRSSLFKRIVAHAIEQGGSGSEELLKLLGEYRGEPGLSAVDEAWAIARQAELRLERGETEEALTRLMIDMRRLESRLTAANPVNLGELYVLLGRAYYESGDEETAEQQLRHGLGMLRGEESARGMAMAILGQIELGRGNLDEARQSFDAVVVDFAETAMTASGLLGRAQALSSMGDHEKALADYNRLADMLEQRKPMGSVSAVAVAQSLVDRHDASLSLGDYPTAVGYVLAAERLFPVEKLPTSVLFRIASTSRLIADSILREAIGDRPLVTASARDVDPSIREQANRHYKRAADYYVRHARASAARVEDEHDWADSLWMAADSYDLAGWHDQAIDFFKEYVSGRPSNDSRRAEARFRMAQAYHAQLDHAAAAGAYRDVIEQYPMSPFESQSHVPLAQCLEALGRKDEAAEALSKVIDGSRNLKPDSPEFRSAVIEYGKLLFEQGEFARAVEQFDRALKWYPSDPEAIPVRFRLAESYRGLAQKLTEKLKTPSLTPSERDEFLQERDTALNEALEQFDLVVDRLERADGRRVGADRDIDLRLAVMYRADAAFELGEYERAIQLYEQAERKYHDHPSSVLALIQIVNAHAALGQTDQAKTAHRRAQIRLAQLPAEAFSAPEAIFDRATWERWLASSPIELSATGGGNPNKEPQ